MHVCRNTGSTKNIFIHSQLYCGNNAISMAYLIGGEWQSKNALCGQEGERGHQTDGHQLPIKIYNNIVK